MQKLISLFAEALEIMNIKAKLNVFLPFSENTILFSQQAIFVVYLTTQTRFRGMEIFLVQMKLCVIQELFYSVCNLKLNTNKSRKLIFSSFSFPRLHLDFQLMCNEGTEKKKHVRNVDVPMFIYIKPSEIEEKTK